MNSLMYRVATLMPMRDMHCSAGDGVQQRWWWGGLHDCVLCSGDNNRSIKLCPLIHTLCTTWYIARYASTHLHTTIHCCCEEEMHGWNDYTVDMPPLHSLAGWGKCMPCCSNTWNAHNTCLQTLPYYCSCWVRSHSREICIVRKGRSALFASYHVCRAAKGDTWWGSAIHNAKLGWLYSECMSVHTSTSKHATTLHACLLHMMQWHEMIYSTTLTNHAFSSSHHGFHCDATHSHYIQQLNQITHFCDY